MLEHHHRAEAVVLPGRRRHPGGPLLPGQRLLRLPRGRDRRRHGAHALRRRRRPAPSNAVPPDDRQLLRHLGHRRLPLRQHPRRRRRVHQRQRRRAPRASPSCRPARPTPWLRRRRVPPRSPRRAAPASRSRGRRAPTTRASPATGCCATASRSATPPRRPSPTRSSTRRRTTPTRPDRGRRGQPLAAEPRRSWRRTGVMLLTAGSTWRYLDNGVNQGTAWRAGAFNDTTWRTGAAQLGYGDGDETTVVGFGPDPNHKYTDDLLPAASSRSPTPPSWRALTLRLIRDDGAVVYINGTEVARCNMPTGRSAAARMPSTTSKAPTRARERLQREPGAARRRHEHDRGGDPPAVGGKLGHQLRPRAQRRAACRGSPHPRTCTPPR